MRSIIAFILIALAPTAALADKFEVRYRTSTGSTSVYVEIGRTAVNGGTAATAEGSVCNLAWQYVARGVVQGVRVWRLTEDSTQAAMTRDGSTICRAIESGVVEN
jgi:hypothetical protein